MICRLFSRAAEFLELSVHFHVNDSYWNWRNVWAKAVKNITIRIYSRMWVNFFFSFPFTLSLICSILFLNVLYFLSCYYTNYDKCVKFGKIKIVNYKDLFKQPCTLYKYMDAILESIPVLSHQNLHVFVSFCWHQSYWSKLCQIKKEKNFSKVLHSQNICRICRSWGFQK